MGVKEAVEMHKYCNHLYYFRQYGNCFRTEGDQPFSGTRIVIWNPSSLAFKRHFIIFLGNANMGVPITGFFFAALIICLYMIV
ncbi:hypothetical protein CW304_23385 [Bacillus sp. UFRGS-B20]|nr:hypothetical protein CW304_23385 [Bacillus sp. UFRGS-B20]